MIKKAILLTTSLAVLFCLSGLPLMAQARPGGMGHGPAMGHEPQTGNRPMPGQQPGMGSRGMGRSPSNPYAKMPHMHIKMTPAQALALNNRLSSRLKTMLPAGESVQKAASGFKNLGRFVAAVNVSHNLDLPFNQLKNKVTSGDSLGKAIHTMDSSLTHKEVKHQVKKAKHEAKKEIRVSRS